MGIAAPWTGGGAPGAWKSALTAAMFLWKWEKEKTNKRDKSLFGGSREEDTGSFSKFAASHLFFPSQIPAK